jgi:hypothetical protein
MWLGAATATFMLAGLASAPQPPPSAVATTQAECAAARSSCQHCRAAGRCAWCGGYGGQRARCVVDEPGVSCDGAPAVPPVGFAGGRWMCPVEGERGAPLPAAAECLGMAQLAGLHRPLDVVAARIETSGWLVLHAPRKSKSTGKVTHGWRRRWCRVVPGRVVACGRNPGATLKVWANISRCTSLGPSTAQVKPVERELELTCGRDGKKQRLYGDDGATQRRWTRALLNLLIAARCEVAARDPQLQPPPTLAEHADDGGGDSAPAAYARGAVNTAAALALTRLGLEAEAVPLWGRSSALIAGGGSLDGAGDGGGGGAGAGSAGWAIVLAATRGIFQPHREGVAPIETTLLRRGLEIMGNASAQQAAQPGVRTALGLEQAKGLALLLLLLQSTAVHPHAPLSTDTMDRPQMPAATAARRMLQRAVEAGETVDGARYLSQLDAAEKGGGVLQCSAQPRPGATDQPTPRVQYRGFVLPPPVAAATAAGAPGTAVAAAAAAAAAAAWVPDRVGLRGLTARQFRSYVQKREPCVLGGGGGGGGGGGDHASAALLAEMGAGWGAATVALRNRSYLMQVAGESLVGVEAIPDSSDDHSASSNAVQFGAGLFARKSQLPLEQALELVARPPRGWRHYINLSPARQPGPSLAAAGWRRAPLDRGPFAALQPPAWLRAGAGRGGSTVRELNLWLAQPPPRPGGGVSAPFPSFVWPRFD